MQRSSWVSRETSKISKQSCEIAGFSRRSFESDAKAIYDSLISCGMPGLLCPNSNICIARQGQSSHQISLSPSLTFSHSLSVLTYPELSPRLLRRFPSSAAAGRGRRCTLDSSWDSTALEDIFAGSGAASVSVSLPGSGLRSILLFPSGSVLLVFCSACNSRANQLIEYQRPAQRKDRTMKWTLRVAARRARRRNCSAPNVALVATRRVGVGPGVKTEFHRSSRNDAMLESGLLVYWTF